MTTLHPISADDFSAMDDDALAAAVSTLAAHIHAATYRLLVLIAELDRREVWAAQGALSCAHWLSWACGIDTHTAREKVRVARALGELPLLSEALAKGELGYSKVRALTRIATSENAEALLRRRNRPRRRWTERRATECRVPHSQHPAGGSPRPLEPRRRLPLPRLHRHAAPPRSPRPALGRRRRDLARQPRPALSDPPSPRARGRVRRAAPRRRRVPVHQPLRRGRLPSATAGDLFTRHHRRRERIPRTRHRLRDRHGALARRAYRLRPCADGCDGVVGFGRHAPGGGACGRGLESVVERDRPSREWSTSCRVRTLSEWWTLGRRLVTAAPKLRPAVWRKAGVDATSMALSTELNEDGCRDCPRSVTALIVAGLVTE